jgi:hypothetical protein
MVKTKKPPLTISHRQLLRVGACPRHRKRFRELFGTRPVRVTPKRVAAWIESGAKSPGNMTKSCMLVLAITWAGLALGVDVCEFRDRMEPFTLNPNTQLWRWNREWTPTRVRRASEAFVNVLEELVR